MTPKEKANEIWDKFYDLEINNPVPSALICVDEILLNDYGSRKQMSFWNEVKQEIIKL